MLPPAMEGCIEETVDFTQPYLRVSERYWTKYYFVPKDKKRRLAVENDTREERDEVMKVGENKDLSQEEEMRTERETGKNENSNDKEGSKGTGERGKTENGNEEEGNEKTRETENWSEEGNKITRARDIEENRNGNEKEGNEAMEVEHREDTSGRKCSDEGAEEMENITTTVAHGKDKATKTCPPRGLDSGGDVCVMVHTNKLCLVTLSPRHPVLAQGKEVMQVSYDVGRFNRLDNQVSGKGKRGAQMMGPQSPVCIITCSDGSRYSVLAGVHGKLVEVNERLITYPKLMVEHPDAEGYLAVILPPLRNGDTMLKRLFTAEEYWAMDR